MNHILFYLYSLLRTLLNILYLNRYLYSYLQLEKEYNYFYFFVSCGKILWKKEGNHMEDTIVAISTSVGEGAISIIRLSGNEAINIASKVFTKDLTKVASHTIHYGYIKDKEEKIDEVLVSVMKSPKTFTREDIVEINCHGGLAPTNKVLEILLENGARLAEPGEFTKRAFLNGRIDLLEAEATMDLISSKAESTRKISINTLTGETSNLIKDLRNEKIARYDRRRVGLIIR